MSAPVNSLPIVTMPGARNCTVAAAGAGEGRAKPETEREKHRHLLVAA
jgi:hypothetical protein